MKTRKLRKNRQKGFSLAEMLIAIAILAIIMGAVFKQIDKTQKRYRAEESKLDIAQESREFMDQVVRDLRQEGYPNTGMYNATALNPVIMNPPEQDSRNAVGLVRYSPTDIQFEGDVDGDGVVDEIRYTLQPAAGNTCPCTVRRSQQPKVNGTAPTAQVPVYSTELENVINSGGAGGGGTNGSYTITGTMQFQSGATNVNAFYSTYAQTPIFQAFDSNGNAVGATDYATNPAALKTIKTITITLNVLARSTGSDLDTKLLPVSSMTASVRLPN